MAHRAKRTGDLPAAGLSENTMREAQPHDSDKPSICSLYQRFEASLFSVPLQSTRSLTNVDHVLQSLILMSATMHECYQKQRSRSVRFIGDHTERQRHHVTQMVGVDQICLHLNHHPLVIAVQPLPFPWARGGIALCHAKTQIRKRFIHARERCRLDQDVNIRKTT